MFPHVQNKSLQQCYKDQQTIVAARDKEIVDAREEEMRQWYLAQQKLAATTTTTTTTTMTSESHHTTWTSLLPLVTHGHRLTWWKCYIFPFLNPDGHDRFLLRRYCRLFRDALLAPVWTTFPHPNYPTLDKLIRRINEVSTGLSGYPRRPNGKDPSKAPSLVFVLNGLHRVTLGLTIQCSVMIVGESRKGTVVADCNITINGQHECTLGGSVGWDAGMQLVQTLKKSAIYIRKCHVGLKTLTLRNSDGNGLSARFGGSFHAKEVSFIGCQYHGVVANNIQGTLTDCSVTNCGKSGIVSEGKNGVINIYGEQTNVEGNCANGTYWRNPYETIHCYGLDAGFPDAICDNTMYGKFTAEYEQLKKDMIIAHTDSVNVSKIILHAPLTKESVSHDNVNDQNWDWDAHGTSIVEETGVQKEEEKEE